MKLVIDIPKKTYNEIKERTIVTCGESFAKTLVKYIKNGTPLPEHHSRLISADSLIKAIEEKAKRLSNTDTINGLCGAVALIFDEPTIIEGEESEKRTCANCLLDGTDACSRGAGRAVDDSVCEDFI